MTLQKLAAELAVVRQEAADRKNHCEHLEQVIGCLQERLSAIETTAAAVDSNGRTTVRDHLARQARAAQIAGTGPNRPQEARAGSDGVRQGVSGERVTLGGLDGVAGSSIGVSGE